MPRSTLFRLCQILYHKLKENTIHPQSLEDAVRPFCAAEELRVVQHGFPTSHAVTDAKFDVLATEMAFGLINGSELVNYTVTDVQSVDPADFNTDSNANLRRGF